MADVARSTLARLDDDRSLLLGSSTNDSRQHLQVVRVEGTDGHVQSLSLRQNLTKRYVHAVLLKSGGAADAFSPPLI